ncbi:MAG: hypothetical protein ABI595_13135 [Actinomycetota bacterium]
MADVVAMVGIASGATVAVVVPLISSRLERQRLGWEGPQLTNSWREPLH